MSNYNDQNQKRRGPPRNQITLAGQIRPSQLSSGREVLEFELNLGVFQLKFRIPIGDADEVPVYVRYYVHRPKVNMHRLRQGRFQDDGDGDDEDDRDSWSGQDSQKGD